MKIMCCESVIRMRVKLYIQHVCRFPSLRNIYEKSVFFFPENWLKGKGRIRTKKLFSSLLFPYTLVPCG